MECITLNAINKQSNIISYDFSISNGLAQYFTDTVFEIHYPENIESVPDSIAAVPFVCNVLPIIWLTDSKLMLASIDKAFYDCIPNVRHGYEAMFPESTFAGQIIADEIVPCDRPANGGSAAFFSGGLDAVNTLVNHFDEHPALISIWGADIAYDNEEGWSLVHAGIAEYAARFNLPDVVIRSRFRQFDKEGVLHKRFYEQLQDGWWHGVKHALGLIGHAAPYAYLHNLSTIYIASTNCPDDGPVRCASNPSTDNHIRFAIAQIVHDGFEFSRQGKAHNIVAFSLRRKEKFPLHVCWESTSGSNCCRCEKCYRTMANLMAEGANPVDYGFEHAPATIPLMRLLVTTQYKNMEALHDYWPHTQKRITENAATLSKLPYWKDIKWMLHVDFTKPSTLKAPLSFRIKTKLSTMRFYQALHRLKEHFHG